MKPNRNTQAADSKIKPTPKAMLKARNRLRATIAAEKMAGTPKMDSTEAVTDPVITPFLMAMEDLGMKPLANKAGALLIERCNACQQSSRFSFQRDTGTFTLCAQCHD